MKAILAKNFFLVHEKPAGLFRQKIPQGRGDLRHAHGRDCLNRIDAVYSIDSDGIDFQPFAEVP